MHYPFNNYTPLGNVIPFRAFLQGSPDMPEIYWNVQSSEQRIRSICAEIGKLVAYCDNLANCENATREFVNELAVELHEVQYELDKLAEDFEALQQGGKVRNAVTGMYNRSYVAEKQVFDLLRVYASTWAELESLNKTYAEYEADGYSYADVEMFGNLYYGNGKVRAKITKANTIDANTPGFGYVKESK